MNEVNLRKACERIGKKTMRSTELLMKLVKHLDSLGGKFSGLQADLFSPIGKPKTITHVFRALRNAEILSADYFGGEWHCYLNYEAIDRFIENSFSTKKTPLRRCPGCGCMANEYVETVCLGCYMTERAKREKKERMKV